MRARQGDEIVRADSTTRLGPESQQRARRRRSPHAVNRVRTPRPEHRLERDAGDEVGRERVLGDRPDLAVVHALCDGHGKGREDVPIGQATDGLRLHRTEVLAAMVERRFELEAVELEVDLEPSAEAPQGVGKRIVLDDPDAVRVQHHARHVPFRRRRDDLEDLRMDRRFATGEHQHVDPPAFAGDGGFQ